MKKLLTVLFILALLAGILPVTPVFADGAYVTDLLAGQTLDVGDIIVDSDGEMLYITFQISDTAWNITESHVYVGTAPPNKAAPGQFPYKHEGLNTRLDRYEIPLADLGLTAGDEVIVATHAKVQMVVGWTPPAMEDFNATLPTYGDVVITHMGDETYYNINLYNTGTLDDQHNGWCMDTDIGYYWGGVYDVDIYSTYDPDFLAMGLVEYPENFDLVNYIVNQHYVGQTSRSGGVYTIGDVQRAMWTLIDDEVKTGGLGVWSQIHADEILADAYAYGEGYVPGCGGLVAVALTPADGASHVTIIEVSYAQMGLGCDPIYGDQEETAWGFGEYNLPHGWGWYFTYTLP
jgi:hypothetical protein